MMYYSVFTCWLVFQISIKSMNQSAIIEFNPDIQLQLNDYQSNLNTLRGEEFSIASADYNSSRSNK